MSKKFRAVMAATLALSLLALAGCGAAQTASSSGSTEKVLKIGSDINYPPFEFMDTKNQPQGFDIDLINAVAKDMGYTVKFETAAFDGLIPALSTGKYDAVISAMTITDERAKSVLFSDKYFMATQYIAVKKSSPIKSEADLKGKRVAVQQATTGQTAVEKLGINPKKFDTTPDAMTDMINGGSDAVVADSPVVLYFIQQNPNANVTAIQGNFEKEFYGIAFKQDNKELAGKVNASLKKLIDNGEYNKIYKKWFGQDAPKLS